MCDEPPYYCRALDQVLIALDGVQLGDARLRYVQCANTMRTLMIQTSTRLTCFLCANVNSQARVVQAIHVRGHQRMLRGEVLPAHNTDRLYLGYVLGGGHPGLGFRVELLPADLQILAQHQANFLTFEYGPNPQPYLLDEGPGHEIATAICNTAQLYGHPGVALEESHWTQNDDQFLPAEIVPPPGFDAFVVQQLELPSVRAYKPPTTADDPLEDPEACGINPADTARAVVYLGLAALLHFQTGEFLGWP